MIIDISDILSCENKEETKQVQIELTSFISKLGEFPIISAAPIELRIANRENKRLLIQGDVDLRVSIPCSRCLEEVPTDIHFSIDKDIKLEDSKKDGAGVICTECWYQQKGFPYCRYQIRKNYFPMLHCLWTLRRNCRNCGIFPYQFCRF